MEDNMDFRKEIETSLFDKDIRVNISEDRMCASVNLSTISDSDSYTFDEIMDKLTESGVKTGIDEAKIREIIEDKLYDQNITVAIGKNVENGEDGYYNFMFDIESLNKNKPTVREDGSVDYFNVKLFEKVNNGDKLAEYIEPTKGNFGFDVTGKLLVPKPGRPQPKIRGKGFRISEDGKEYYATIDGKVEYCNYDLNVINVFEVRGDVDLSIGNIDFNGDVSISGGVRSGITVHAMGNIFVGGFVEGANLKAGKDIVLQDGVNGRSVGKLEAEGSISARFFENASIFVKEDIKCSYMLNCKAIAYGKIYVEGKKGSIIGGDVTGVMGIETNSCGIETATKTVLRVGSTKEIRREYAELIMKLRDVSTQIDNFDDALKMYEELKETGSERYDKDMVTRIIQSKIVKKAEKAKYEERSKELYGLIRESERSVVRIAHNIYPGSRVIMDDKSYVPSSIFTHILVKKTPSAIVLRDYDDY